MCFNCRDFDKLGNHWLAQERHCPSSPTSRWARERERHHQRNSRSAAAGSGFRRCVRAAPYAGG
jgi:hypothetical protein